MSVFSHVFALGPGCQNVPRFFHPPSTLHTRVETPHICATIPYHTIRVEHLPLTGASEIVQRYYTPTMFKQLALVGVAVLLATVQYPMFAQADGTCNGCPPFPFTGSKDNSKCRDTETIGTNHNCCTSSISDMWCASGYYAKQGGSNCGFFGGSSFECYSGKCRCETKDGCMANSCQCKYDSKIEFCSKLSCSATEAASVATFCPCAPTQCTAKDGTCFRNSCQCKSDESIKFCSNSACATTAAKVCPSSPPSPSPSPYRSTTLRPTPSPSQRPTPSPSPYRSTTAPPPTAAPTTAPTLKYPMLSGVYQGGSCSRYKAYNCQDFREMCSQNGAHSNQCTDGTGFGAGGQCSSMTGSVVVQCNGFSPAPSPYRSPTPSPYQRPTPSPYQRPTPSPPKPNNLMSCASQGVYDSDGCTASYLLACLALPE